LPDSPPAPSSPPPAGSGAAATAKVWDLPQRIVHWALATSVLTAWFTANVFDTVHETAGYTALGLVAFRVLWGFIGPPHARFANFVRRPVIVLRYLGRLVVRQNEAYLGHNPAGGAMAVTLLLLVAVASISGWMQITERFFGVDWVEELHSLSSNLVLILAVVHVLGVLLMCVLQRENLVLGMITGRKRPLREGKSGERGLPGSS
jgi:cytochrome b